VAPAEEKVELNLHTLKPAQPRKERKRVGRGLGSGKGRYSGRGIKGQKSRAGSHKMNPGFEGGQMPIDMRIGKLRGNTSADAMPIGPFRTFQQPVNVSSLSRFDAGTEVTPELLKQAGLIGSVRKDVKILGQGDLTVKLTISAHGFSKSALEKIEAAGGSVVWLRGEPVEKKRKKKSKAKPAATEPDETATEVAAADEAPVAEAADETGEPGATETEA
jgi:large subunit ribosomal protein L15